MRTFVLALLAVCSPVLAQTDYGTITFTNKSGAVTSNAVVTKVEAGKLTYHYSGAVGGGVVRLADLPEVMQARFGYSPNDGDNAAALARHAQPTEAERKKFEEAKAKAETGVAQAQGDLGSCYYTGDGVTKDVVEAVKWFRKAAEQGNARGENGLGHCYANGDGVSKDVVEAVKWFRKAAAQGYAKAQFNLGNCYFNGNGVTKDEVEAVNWYRKAAEQGFALGQLNLGVSYQDGDGVTKDLVEAVNWYRKAAEQGIAQAQCNLGICYDTGNGVTKDAVEAVKWFQKAAEQGFAQAEFILGVCYYNGKGVTKDAVEAVNWFRKGAEQGDPTVENLDFDMRSACAFHLGLCYYKGDGVTKDSVEASKWFRKAAAQGFDLAGEAANLIETNRIGLEALGQTLVSAFSERSYYRGVAPGQDAITFTNKFVTFTNLQGRVYRDVRLVRADLDGIIYREEGASGGRVCYTNLSAGVLESLGVPTNRIAAAKARADNSAALQGPAQQTEADRKKFEETKAKAENGDAQAQLFLGIYCDITKDAVEAVKWYRKAAEQGNSEAQFTLGFCYDRGENVTQDAVEATKWYHKAAEQGHAGAQFNLGWHYYRGDGVIQDAVEAVKWYRKAAEQGDCEAQYALGLCHVAGSGVTEDVVEAVKWFRKAAERGDAKAQFKLACCYDKGDGVTQDAVEAVKWYRKAAEQGNQLAQDKLTALGQALETLSLTTKVMETNDIWWRWSYQLQVRNNTDQPIYEFPRLLFLDAGGFIVEEEPCEVKLSARETKTVLGTALVRHPGAAKVKTIRLK